MELQIYEHLPSYPILKHYFQLLLYKREWQVVLPGPVTSQPWSFACSPLMLSLVALHLGHGLSQRQDRSPWAVCTYPDNWEGSTGLEKWPRQMLTCPQTSSPTPTNRHQSHCSVDSGEQLKGFPPNWTMTICGRGVGRRWVQPAPLALGVPPACGPSSGSQRGS